MSTDDDSSRARAHWPTPISFAWASEAEYRKAVREQRDVLDIFGPEFQERVLARRAMNFHNGGNSPQGNDRD